MFIIYNTNGKAVKTADSEPDVRVPHISVLFPDWETRNAAWIADATAEQALAAFGGLALAEFEGEEVERAA